MVKKQVLIDRIDTLEKETRALYLYLKEIGVTIDIKVINSENHCGKIK